MISSQLQSWKGILHIEISMHCQLITTSCYNFRIQSNLDYPDSFGHRKFLDVRIAKKVRITKIKMAAVHKHPNDGLDR